MTFMTEKDMEALLEMETRDLPLPDGTTHPHTAFKLIWSSVEVLEYLGTDLDTLMKAAIEEAELQDLELGEAFDGVVAWLHNEAKDSYNKYI